MHLHILDPDPRRRASVSRAVLALDVHGEKYASYSEFSAFEREEGIVLVAEAIANDALEELRAGSLDMPVIVYAQNPETEQVVRTIQRGALDYIAWPVSAERLTKALKRLREENERKSTILEKQRVANRLVQTLTPREKEVLTGLVAGGTNKAIANTLGISSKTVEIHRANLMRKLRARSQADAVKIAVYAGLDEDLPMPS